VTLTIASGTGYTVGTPSSATGTIADNDVASLSVGDASVTESNSGTSTVSITITLSAALATSVSFSISTVAGTATAGTDFQAKTQTLTIAAGATSVVFQVVIVNDRTFEPTETFTVVIASGSVNPSSVPIARGTGTVTIVDNDKALTASAAAPGSAGGAVALQQAQVSSALAGALQLWAREGIDASGLASVAIELVDLPGAELAEADLGVIRLDADAAGWGWTVAGGRMDLTVVLAHELGHLLGFSHDDAWRYPIMAETLTATDQHLIRPGRQSSIKLRSASWLGGPRRPASQRQRLTA